MVITVNGLKLFYDKQGSGQPILLLHGNGESHEIFDVLTRELARHHTVYALDSRGHGRSDRVPLYHYEDMASDVAEFIKQLGLEKPWVCGFSDGAIVGLLVELRNPGLLGKLVVCGANLNPQGILPLTRQHLKLTYRLFHDERVGMMLREPNISLEELSGLRLPVLVLAGSRDLIRPKHTRAIANAIPGSRLLILPGESHSSYVVHSGLLYAAMRTFLEGTHAAYYD